MDKEPKNLRIILAGSVGSSRRTLDALIRHRMNLVGVLGLSLKKSANVSGYTRLDDLAKSAGVPYHDFENINSTEVISTIRKWAPDILFVVGLSQMVKKELLAIPQLGCVGFHPTRLPEGRGRAPVAWLTLENRSGAASFFMMDEGADSGPILVQEPFEVNKQDYASDVSQKMEDAIDRALTSWLPKLKSGEWKPVYQDESKATFYGRRMPVDGLIDWSRSAEEILALVRAASRPHPGAFTYVEGSRLIIWRAALEKKLPYHGVIGRILLTDEDKGCLVQTGDGLLWLLQAEYAPDESDQPELRVGVRLGYSAEEEIAKLRMTLRSLDERLSRLESERNGKS